MVKMLCCLGGSPKEGRLITAKNEYLPAAYSKDKADDYPISRVLNSDKLLDLIARLKAGLPNNTEEKSHIIIVNVYMIDEKSPQEYPVTVCVASIKRNQMRLTKQSSVQADQEVPFTLLRLCLVTKKFPWSRHPFLKLQKSIAVNCPLPKGNVTENLVDYNELLDCKKMLIIDGKDTDLVPTGSFYPLLSNLAYNNVEQYHDLVDEKYIKGKFESIKA